MKQRIAGLGAVIGALFFASACSSGHHTAAPTTTTTTAPNPDVIPAVITPAYVDAVFKVLNHVYGDATRSLASAKQVTDTVQANLRAIFNDPLYENQLSQARQSLQGAISNVRPDPGDALTTVRALLGSTSNCIFVETKTDLTSVLSSSTPQPASEFYELSPKQPGNDPQDINPTPWAISFNVDYLNPTSLPDRCG